MPTLPRADDSSAAVHAAVLSVDGAAGPLAARLYRSAPPGARVRKHSLLIFFHGGDFVRGDLDAADAFLRALAGANPHLLVLASSYTLADQAPFPAAAEDAHAVLAWARTHRAALGWSGRRLVVAGIDAGANLATVADLMNRDRGGPAIAAQILIMPMLDAGLNSASMRAPPRGVVEACLGDACAGGYRRYLPHAADRMHPYASPLQSSRLRHAAPALIISVDADPLRDEAEQYAARLLASGVAATALRLPAGALAHADGRAECASQARVLAAITQFLQTP